MDAGGRGLVLRPEKPLARRLVPLQAVAMIFDPWFTEPIRRGRKTVTRRPVNGAPCGVRVGSIQKLQPGQGQPAMPGRIHVLGITLERLKDITDADARREGYGGRNPRRAFLRSWGKRYGGRSTQSVYRIEFEYLPRD